jgi:hypothetical protein
MPRVLLSGDPHVICFDDMHLVDFSENIIGLPYLFFWHLGAFSLSYIALKAKHDLEMHNRRVSCTPFEFHFYLPVLF